MGWILSLENEKTLTIHSGFLLGMQCLGMECLGNIFCVPLFVFPVKIIFINHLSHEKQLQ